MSDLDRLRIIGSSDRFQPVRDSAGRMVCEYNAATREIRVIKRNGQALTATLPDRPIERPDEPRQYL